MSAANSPYDAGTIPRCYRHPDRETYITCQRCGRPICPDCMRQASVGFQCPDCVRQGAAQSRPVRTSFGGRVAEGVPVVTIGLIAVNVLFFLIAYATGGMTGSFSKTMLEIPDSSAYAPGAGVEGIAQGAYWQLISSTFLHIEIWHIGFNMVGLWIFGRFLESQLGRWRFLSAYLLTGFVGSVAVYWLERPDYQPSLGASGSIFGLFAAALVVLLKQHRDITQLIILLVLNLVITFTVPHISWQAHIAGLVSGLLIGAGFAYAPRENRTLLHIAMLGAIFAVAVAAVVLRTAQLTG
ncbi:MAG: rhomboid family intramembrane serine protease [Nocardioidaceae bacterium]